MIKTMMILVVMGVMAGRCNGECVITDARTCLHDFYGAKVTPNNACMLIESVKQCFVDNDCCDEYKQKHCIKVLSKKQQWKNKFAQFHGCDTNVCSCSVKKTFKRNHEETVSYSGMWYFLIWIIFIMFIVAIH